MDRTNTYSFQTFSHVLGLALGVRYCLSNMTHIDLVGVTYFG